MLMLQTALALLLAASSFSGVSADRIKPEVHELKIRLERGEGGQALTETVKQEKALSRKNWRIGATDKLSLNAMIHVNDKPLSVQQVVLGVYSHETKSETSFICPSKQNGQYACALDLKEASVQSSVDPGQTTLKLYIASHDVIPVSYNVGDIELSFTAPQKEESVWDIFHPLPEIKHQFRADEKMPNQLLSSVFSLGVLAPWLLLIGMYVSLSANVKNLFANSPSLTFGSVFIASLAAVMSLYYVYWLRLNLFQLLGYGSVIGVVTAVFGRQALVARAGLRGVTRTKKDF